MNVREFLEAFVSLDTHLKYRAIIFFGKTYPAVFFSLMLKNIQSKRKSSFLDLELYDEAICKAQLETSFLGQTQWYWLGDLSALSPKKRTFWLSYCKRYQGPHTLAYFAGEAAGCSTDATRVTVDSDSFDALKDSKKLGIYLYGNPGLFSLIETNPTVFKGAKIDTICLVYHYIPLLGKSRDDFITQWLPLLVSSEHSLFLLSGHLFSKNPVALLSLWKRVHSDYPVQFWVSFWSEQISRAYGFIIYSQQKQYTEAKKIAYRLPFSFIKNDWKLVTLDELANAHNFLYKYDFHVKNGGSDLFFDLFYGQFFAGNFVKNL
jgi:hypothetical protein